MPEDQFATNARGAAAGDARASGARPSFLRRGLRRSRRSVATAVAVALTALIALSGTLAAQEDWCSEDDRDPRRHCEVREFTLPATGSLTVDAAPNGGIRVTGWDRDEIRVLAKVVARAADAARAREIAAGVEVEPAAAVRARGPRAQDGEGWWVSYRVDVPRQHDLRLASTNGGVSIAGVRGDLDLSTTNGGLRLEDVGGDVRARTTNGGITVRLTGSRWEGAGLDAQTTNGGVDLHIPSGYSAHLEAGTQNGGFEIDFPITVQGRIRRSIDARLGDGGAPVRVRTTNGGVTIRRAG